MSDLDLDALDEYSYQPGRLAKFFTGDDLHVLIERVREVERFLAERGEMLSNQEQLIRKLERVISVGVCPECHQHKLTGDTASYHGGFCRDEFGFHAALAALEEP